MKIAKLSTNKNNWFYIYIYYYFLGFLKSQEFYWNCSSKSIFKIIDFIHIGNLYIIEYTEDKYNEVDGSFVVTFAI